MFDREINRLYLHLLLLSTPIVLLLVIIIDISPTGWSTPAHRPPATPSSTPSTEPSRKDQP